MWKISFKISCKISRIISEFRKLEKKCYLKWHSFGTGWVAHCWDWNVRIKEKRANRKKTFSCEQSHPEFGAKNVKLHFNFNFWSHMHFFYALTFKICDSLLVGESLFLESVLEKILLKRFCGCLLLLVTPFPFYFVWFLIFLWFLIASPAFIFTPLNYW